MNTYRAMVVFDCELSEEEVCKSLEAALEAFAGKIHGEIAVVRKLSEDEIEANRVNSTRIHGLPKF